MIPDAIATAHNQKNNKNLSGFFTQGMCSNMSVVNNLP